MADYDLIVVGGGAAGFYGAIQAGTTMPGARILILEKTNKLLSKVRVSGGGRCNVTHFCFNPVSLARHYPRGEKKLKTIFKRYNASHTVEWFESKGVRLKTEEDGRMFPKTDTSQTIINCFLSEAQRLGISIQTGEGVDAVIPRQGGLAIRTGSGKEYHAKEVLIATGGSANPNAYRFIETLGHTIVAPIPSLFTFNDAGRKFADLMGIAVPDAEVRIAGTKFSQRGSVLITHWGLSGPAVIKLSAWAAEYLHSVDYTFTVLVSWIGSVKEETLRADLFANKSARGKQKICKHPLFGLPQRLWERLCALAEIEEHRHWSDAGQKQMNRLLEHLIKCPFQIRGKTTFKDEFVTCGGVDLNEVDLDTMRSKKVSGLSFAGEVLNIDGETGGFNFQSAWSTAALAAMSAFRAAR